MVKIIFRVVFDTNFNCIYFYLKVLFIFLFKKKYIKLFEMWIGSMRRGLFFLVRVLVVVRGMNICEILGQVISFTNKIWFLYCRLCWYIVYLSVVMVVYRKRRRRIWSFFIEYLKVLFDVLVVRFFIKYGFLVVYYVGFLLNMVWSYFSYKNKIREHGVKVGFFL